MNKKIAQKWIKALRSGKYKQTKDVLFNKDTNSYCCLGVLCKVVGVKDPSRVTNGELDPNTTLSLNIMKKTGIGSNDGSILIDGKHSSLAILNDTGKSFTEIADIIEKYWEEL